MEKQGYLKGYFGLFPKFVASFIKESLMRTHSFVFPNHGTNEKVPYDMQ